MYTGFSPMEWIKLYARLFNWSNYKKYKEIKKIKKLLEKEREFYQSQDYLFLLANGLI